MVKFRPPVTWFGQHIEWLGVSVLLALAAFFRFWHLPSLPPGLATPEGRLGLEAWNLAQHGWLPGLTSANGYAPLFVWLEALPVKLLGPTDLALRLWPALLGVAAVLATWLWARDWFNRRIAWIAGLVMAVTPWAVTLGRGALPVGLMLLLVPLTLWVAGWAYHRRDSRWSLALAGLLVLNLMAGPLGWLLVAVVLALGIIRLSQRAELMRFDRTRITVMAGFAIGLSGLVFLVVSSVQQLRQGLTQAGLPGSIDALADTWIRLLLMFNLKGDENPLRNFGAEPLLNAFIGLMFVAGILAAASRFAQRRYRVVLILLLVLLLPAWLSTAGAPNAAHAAAALPVVAVLAGIGVSYMLELWYATFPINSAARSAGQAVIIVLLGLTVFQGYAHYFRAWAGSSDTYRVYNEPAVATSDYLRGPREGQMRYAVATADELPVLSYLKGKADYQLLTPAQVTALPLGTGRHIFVITEAARDETTQQLRVKYPGGTLKPHLSSFSQNEIFYSYEVTK